MSKGVEPWSRSTRTYTSKVYSIFVIGFSLSSHFHSSVVLVFFFFLLFLSCGTLPFFWFVLFSSGGALTFFFFVLSLIIELCFHFLVFLGRVTAGGGVDLDDWSEVRLVTTAAGDWSAVRWVAAACDWFTVRWVAEEGDWFEVRWVPGAEFGSSWPKVSVSSSFWVDKTWIHDPGTDKLVTDFFFSSDISRDYCFIFSSKFCIRIIHYIFNASLTAFNWLKQC